MIRFFLVALSIAAFHSTSPACIDCASTLTVIGPDGFSIATYTGPLSEMKLTDYSRSHTILSVKNADGDSLCSTNPDVGCKVLTNVQDDKLKIDAREYGAMFEMGKTPIEVTPTLITPRSF